MLTLAVDTTAEFGSIALADDSGVIEEVLLHEPQGFSGVLFGQIDALLSRRRVDLSDIELFAGASGPGSFTGVRVGLAAIKGLAEVLGKPAAAVSNLEALASFGRGGKRATVIDARRGEIFGALFDASGRAIIDEIVVKFPAFLELLSPLVLPDLKIFAARADCHVGQDGILRRVGNPPAATRDFEWISADFGPFKAALAGTPYEQMPVITAQRALAAAIASIAMQRLNAGGSCDAAAIEANYVRRSDAELLWKTL